LDQAAANRIQAYLKRTFGNPHFQVGAKPGRRDALQVELKGKVLGVVTEDEDEDGSFQFEARLDVGDGGLDAKGVGQIQDHLSKLFGNTQIKVITRPRQKDSAEVELNGEFIAVVYEDDDEDGQFLFEMAILGEDLAG
jgi:hypothetical protein